MVTVIVSVGHVGEVIKIVQKQLAWLPAGVPDPKHDWRSTCDRRAGAAITLPGEEKAQDVHTYLVEGECMPCLTNHLQSY